MCWLRKVCDIGFSKLGAAPFCYWLVGSCWPDEASAATAKERWLIATVDYFAF